MQNANAICEEVCAELVEMRQLGMRVPKKAEVYVREHAAEIAEYAKGGMNTSEIADHVLNLC